MPIDANMGTESDWCILQPAWIWIVASSLDISLGTCALLGFGKTELANLLHFGSATKQENSIKHPF